MSHKYLNFAAGPSTLPESVLKKAQIALLNYENTDRSVLELSHRCKEVMELIQTTQNNLRTLLNIPENYHILFLQGGGTGQFASIPMNLLSSEDKADYIITGYWSKAAYEEAKKFNANVHIAYNTEGTKYKTINLDNLSINPSSRYVYYCDNETVNGLEYQNIPKTSVPLVVDMSSNLLSKPIDVSKYGLIYACTQKNCGITGLSIVIIRDDLIEYSKKSTPSIFNFKLMEQNQSCYNTAPIFSIYMCNLMLQWILDNGGVYQMEEKNILKASTLYSYIDGSNFYYNDVNPTYRSRMNVIINIKDSSLEKLFISEAHKRNIIGIEGHRSVGGIRVSLYNSISIEDVRKFIQFMEQFRYDHLITRTQTK